MRDERELRSAGTKHRAKSNSALTNVPYMFSMGACSESILTHSPTTSTSH